ncbi:hypothetical protein BN135_2250 [Cronobacter muytjensii 530]
MHARLFDMLHDAANQHHFAVTDGVHINLNGIVQEAVQQHWRVVGNAHRRLEVATQVGFVVDDFHRAAAQHVRRAHHQRVADFFRFLDRLFDGRHGGVRRLFQLQAIHRLLKAFAVFGAVDSVRACADNRYACCFQRARQLQRRLAAVLHNNAFRLLDAYDFQHVFQRNRFEVETVGSIVVGGDGFRVAVDHDGLVTVFAQRQCGVYAAVVELNALADTVRPAAQHHDFFTILVRVRLALFFISGVHVGGIGGEFRRAGIHTLIDRMQVVLLAQLADFRFTDAREFRKTRIGEAFTFEHPQEIGVQAVNALLGDLFFKAHQLFNLHQEPAVDVGQVENAVNGQARAESVSDVPDTLGARVFQLTTDFGQRFRVIQAHFRVKTGRAYFQTAQRFLHRLLLSAANRHDLTDRLHLGGQAVVSARKFLKVKARNFGDNVVDRRLEGGRGATAGDVVHQLVEGIAHRQFRRHFGNRETGRF